MFKTMAHLALRAALRETVEVTAAAEFEARWQKLAQRLEEEPSGDYEGLTPKTRYRLSMSDRGNIRGQNLVNPAASSLLCSRDHARDVFVAYRHKQVISSSEAANAVQVGAHTSLIAVVFRELQRQKVDITASMSPSKPEEIRAANVQLLRKPLEIKDKLKPADQQQRFVLIIDEINRGNVSRVLGELITLLEPDKRIGAEHQLIPTLPCTGDPFGVPPNLYVLGTMNTADKSIALVDVALRRRFEFEELMPDFSAAVCPSLSEEMRRVLKELNLRIALRKDREHQIGHSYFIGVASPDQFNRQFRRHVLPLLQEYFYNDWEGLRFVLGEAGNTKGAFIRELTPRPGGSARNRWQWFWDAGAGDVNSLKTLLNQYFSQEDASGVGA